MREIFRKIALIFDSFTTQSRMGMVISGGLFFVFVIVFTLGRHTLFDHDFYSKLADRQQLREIELSVNRGTIYATLDPQRSGTQNSFNTTILATTSVAKDLKIDPSASCNLDMMESFLSEIVYEHLCLERTQVSCFDNIIKYTNTFITPLNFDFSRESIMSFIAPTVREQAHRIYKNRIFLAADVSSTVINTLLLLQNPGLNIIGDSVYVDPIRFDRTRGIDEILRLLNITPKTLDDALQLRKNRNVDIVEKLGPELSLKVNEKIVSQDILVKQQPRKAQDDFILKNTFHKCLKLIDHPVRQYPLGTVASQVT